MNEHSEVLGTVFYIPNRPSMCINHAVGFPFIAFQTIYIQISIRKS